MLQRDKTLIPMLKHFRVDDFNWSMDPMCCYLVEAACGRRVQASIGIIDRPSIQISVPPEIVIGMA